MREFSYLSTRAESVITRMIRHDDIEASESKPYLINVSEAAKFGLSDADARELLRHFRSSGGQEQSAA